MELLESAMAFAVLMILFSTIVTGIVEAIVRLFGLRARTLAQAVRKLFEENLEPILREKLKKAGLDHTIFKTDDFLNQMLDNPAAKGAAGETVRIDWLSLPAFVQRLARTPAGQTIANELRDEIEPILSDLTNTFERYMAASSEVFRKRTHLMTFIVSLVLAFSLNVQATRVFEHLLANPNTRESLIEEADRIADKNIQEIEQLRTLLDEINDVQSLETGAAEPVEDEKLQEIVAKTRELRADLGQLEGKYSLPIGYGQTDDIFAAQIRDNFFSRDGWGLELIQALALWGVNVAIAGVLIALGGPFWYRVFSNLSGLVSALKSLTGKNPELIEDAAPGMVMMGNFRGHANAMTDLFLTSAQSGAVLLDAKETK